MTDTAFVSDEGPVFVSPDRQGRLLAGVPHHDRVRTWSVIEDGGMLAAVLTTDVPVRWDGDVLRFVAEPAVQRAMDCGALDVVAARVAVARGRLLPADFCKLLALSGCSVDYVASRQAELHDGQGDA